MTGTIINAGAIIIGSLIGMIIKKGIPEKIKDVVIRMLGLSVVFIGLNGVITAMITMDQATGKLSSEGGILLLLSLVIGYTVGELLRIEERLNNLGKLVEKRLGAEGFAAGFVNSSLVFCIGAMAIIGSLNDGLYGDHAVLIIKSGLDGICAVIMASSLGVGVLFSFIPVLIYQGGISLGAGYLAPVLSDVLVNNICMVGFAIVLCIGIGFLGYEKIKTANMLPALLVPVIWQVIQYIV